jgi:hypothetical protein
MKKLKNPYSFKKEAYAVLAAFLIIIFTISCSSSDNGRNLPTATSFATLKQDALNSITQNIQVIRSGSGDVNFTSIRGVNVFIDHNNLTLNGNPVTGNIDIKYIEIFDGGNMLVTGKNTMGKMSDGNRALLLSGGEFYINVTKNGQQLQLNGTISLEIPTNLTDGDNGGNPNMTLWNQTENDSVWVPNQVIQNGANGVVLGQGQITPTPIYYAYVGNFGWTNVDCFYSYTGPKTTILASVPNGYTNQNSAIYLHYDGKGSALAQLDTYDDATGLFSEHYGQIPIGLNCHIIFATEENGKSRYAIKSATISAGAIYNFTLNETTLATQAELTSAINALP